MSEANIYLYFDQIHGLHPNLSGLVGLMIQSGSLHKIAKSIDRKTFSVTCPVEITYSGEQCYVVGNILTYYMFRPPQAPHEMIPARWIEDCSPETIDSLVIRDILQWATWRSPSYLTKKDTKTCIRQISPEVINSSLHRIERRQLEKYLGCTLASLRVKASPDLSKHEKQSLPQVEVTEGQENDHDE